MLPESAKPIDGREVPYVGVGVSFPGSQNAATIYYRVNNVFLENDLMVDA